MHVIVPYTDISPKTRLDSTLTASERSAFAQAMLYDVISALQANGHTVELLTPTKTVTHARKRVNESDNTDITAETTEMRSASTPAHETAVEQDAESDTHWSQSPTSAVSITPEVVMMILGGSSDSDGEMSIQHRNNHKDTTQDGIQPNQITVTTDDRALTPAVNGCLNRLSDPKAQFGELAVVMADLALITPTAIERLFAREGDVVLAPGRGGGTNAIVIRHPSFTVNYHGASYQDHHQIAVDASLSVGVIDSMRLGTDIDEPTDLPEVLFHNSGMASEWLQSVGIKLSLDDDTGRVGITHQRNRADED